MLQLLEAPEWKRLEPTKVVPHPVTSEGGAVDLVVLHHTVTGETPFLGIIREIERSHIEDKGYFDFAYNAVTSNVERKAAYGRGPFVQGGATGFPWDAESLSLCAVGDFETDGKSVPSTVLVDNIVDLLFFWIKQGFVTEDFTLAPHLDHSKDGTLCCGKRLVALIPGIRWKLRVKLAGDLPEPAPAPAGMSDAEKLSAIADILAA